MDYRCNKILYFDIMQFGIICVFGHTGVHIYEYLILLFKLGGTLNPQMAGHTTIYIEEGGQKIRWGHSAHSSAWLAPTASLSTASENF
jgi:hypothetical protein